MSQAKQSSLANSLGVLWTAYGPPEGHEKVASVQYFYGLQKPELDREALGVHFCKVAAELKQDPWALAILTEQKLPAYRVLAKTASNQKIRRLARYYVDWADEIEKRAFLTAIKGFASRAAGNIRNMFSRAAKPGVLGNKQVAEGAVAAAKPGRQAATATRTAPGQARPIPEPGGPVAGSAPTTRAQWRAQEVAARKGQQARATATPKPGAAERSATQRANVAAKTGPLPAPANPAQQQRLAETLKQQQAARHGGEAAAAAKRKDIRQTANIAGGRRHTMGEKLLGGGLLAGGVAVPGALAMSAMGGGPQPQYPQYPQYG